MKEKLLDFFRRLPLKIYLAVTAIVIFVFFANNFGLVDVQKTAIIVAAGIDRIEEGFTLTAQIAVPSGGNSPSNTSHVEVHGSGKTVADCISQLYSRTGRVPKFIFCNLIILGEDAVKEDVFGSLDFFLRSEYVSDACFLATCKGTAEEVLRAESALDESSSASIQKLFSEAAVKSGRVSPTTLKDFSIGYYGASKSGAMPYVRVSEFEEGGAQGGGSSEQNGSSGDEKQNKKVFSAEETAIFTQGRLAALLPAEETFAYNLLQGNVFAGAFTVQTEEGKNSVSILKDEGEATLNMKGAPTAELKISLRVDMSNRSTPSDIHEIANSVPSDELCRRAEQLLTQTVDSLWARCKQTKCDLFFLLRQLYRSSPPLYREWEETLLSVARANVQISVQEAR